MNTFDVGRKQLTDKPIIPVVDTRYLKQILILVDILIFVVVHIVILILVLVLIFIVVLLLHLSLLFIILVYLDTRSSSLSFFLSLSIFSFFTNPHVHNSFHGHQVSQTYP